MADQMMMGDQTDPMAAPEEVAGQDYTIEVKVKGGAISVSVEDAAEEDAEEGAMPADGEAPEADTGTPVRNAKDAGRIVADIINNGGQMMDLNQPSAEQASAEDAFKAARGGA